MLKQNKIYPIGYILKEKIEELNNVNISNESLSGAV
jgi:hypothetical protein